MDCKKTLFSCLAAISLIVACAGCNPLAPRPIVHSGYRVPPELIVDAGPVIERGKPQPIIDSIGWVFGIPGRLLLWDPRIDNHKISKNTESVVARYIADNDLHHIKVRLNQYAPIEDWRRLRKNKTVGWPYRYTLGVLSVAGEAILPGRVFGGDHFNPFTSTVHLYSDVPAIGLHEAAHAKDFSRRDYPGTYALVYLLPIVPLWHEKLATGDVVDYVLKTEDEHLIRETYRVLYPAYGTYVGGAASWVLPDYADPLYFGAVLAGHAAAHHHSYEVPERLIHWETAGEVSPESQFFGDTNTAHRVELVAPGESLDGVIDGSASEPIDQRSLNTPLPLPPSQPLMGEHPAQNGFR